MIDGLDWAQSHGDGGEFPKVGHEPGMRIGTQATGGLQFAAKVLQFLFGNAAFEICAGIDSGGGMTLKVDNVAVAAFSLCTKKMIEGDFVERGGGGEGRNVSANAFLHFVGAHHHGQSIPADEALDAAFHLLAAGKRRLLPGRNRILVGRSRRKRKV